MKLELWFVVQNNSRAAMGPVVHSVHLRYDEGDKAPKELWKRYKDVSLIKGEGEFTE